MNTDYCNSSVPRNIQLRALRAINEFNVQYIQRYNREVSHRDSHTLHMHAHYSHSQLDINNNGEISS